MSVNRQLRQAGGAIERFPRFMLSIQQFEADVRARPNKADNSRFNPLESVQARQIQQLASPLAQSQGLAKGEANGVNGEFMVFFELRQKSVGFMVSRKQHLRHVHGQSCTLF